MTTPIRKIFFLSCLMAALVLNYACKDKRPITIGIVNPNPGLEHIIKGFKDGMAEAGYVEGKDVVYLYNGVTRSNEAVDPEIKELLAKKADLLLTITTYVTQRARALTANTNTPVVFGPVFFAVQSGIVADLKRPGGNLTGMQIGGNTQKALEWHLMAAPSTRRMLVPYNDEEPAATQSLDELKEASKKLGIALIIAPVKDDVELREAIEKNVRRADSMWVLNSHFNVRNIKVFEDAGIRFKLPVSSGTSQLGLGMLLSYGQKPYNTGKKASRLASSILSGIPPAEIPVETVDYYLGINLATARAIGVRITDEMLAQAHEIIRE
ncbi:MAG: ABC transporter substrate-binding protein [Deltaproteobacteria bacterium]|nr:ABC transporter substrate-binding protein [Deltaproteobacteria bacterium]